MMDFGPPPKREPRYIPRTPQPRPVATVPPPHPSPQPQPHHQSQPVDIPKQEAEEPKPKSRKRRLKKPTNSVRWIKFACAVVAVGLIAFLAYGYITTKNQLTSQKNSPTNSSQTPTQELINRVGQLVYLPTGETPTIATVNDAAKLKTQEFFANAKDGDKVLIYSKANKAVLYRPSTNKVVEYSTVNLGTNPTQ